MALRLQQKHLFSQLQLDLSWLYRTWFLHAFLFFWTAARWSFRHEILCRRLLRDLFLLEGNIEFLVAHLVWNRSNSSLKTFDTVGSFCWLNYSFLKLLVLGFIWMTKGIHWSSIWFLLSCKALFFSVPSLLVLRRKQSLLCKVQISLRLHRVLLFLLPHFKAWLALEILLWSFLLLWGLIAVCLIQRDRFLSWGQRLASAVALNL